MKASSKISFTSTIFSIEKRIGSRKLFAFGENSILQKTTSNKKDSKDKTKRLTGETVLSLLTHLSCFCLALNLEYLKISFSLFVLFALFFVRIKSETSHHKKYYWLFFLYLCCGLLYSENLDSALKIIETKLSLFLIPLIIFHSKFDFGKIVNSALKTFVQGCYLAIILGLIQAAINAQKTDSLKPFFYGDLALFHHNSYASMYYNFAIIILFVSSLSPKKSLFTTPITAFFGISLLTAGVVLLGSKAGIFTLLLIHFSAMLFWITKHKRYLQGIGSILTIIGVCGLVYIKSPTIQSRINEMTGSFSSKTDNYSSSKSRLASWNASLEVVKTSPIFGCGTGDAQDKLNQYYNTHELYDLGKRKLNSHNQFLTTAISGGLVGLSFLIVILLWQITLARKHKLPILLGLTILTAINFGFESMLEKQDGILFFVFLSCLLISKLRKSIKSPEIA